MHRLDAVHVLGIDRYREVVGDRVEVDIRGATPMVTRSPVKRVLLPVRSVGTASRPFL